ncbi:MAG: aldehyde ferredoxin oxidoreductase family protein [Rectinemataceae bacterium]|nr:aldehyde ferredoxin oxidoreductase family protein [Rectinemataceae bacterium]
MARFHKLLRIDLERQTSRVEEIPSRLERQFLGGKGLATAYLVKELPQGIDPLGPLNKFIITAGPLTGTIAPAAGRFEIVTKSPLTGIYLDCNSGGHFGPEVKAAGFDLVIIEGVSPDPVVLFIENDTVRFIDAASIWGLHVYETERAVRKLVGNPEVRIVSIGPAGENLVKFASLANDYSRSAARGGSGAVLGSKKVKAIAVRGTRDIPIHNLAELKASVEAARSVIFSNPWVPGQRKFGTVRNVGVVNANGFLPVNNFTGGQLPSVKTIDEFAYEERTAKVLSCGECPVACAKGYKRDHLAMEGPEFETVGLFGPNLGILDPDDIAFFNYLCNQNGLDTITSGSLIGGLLGTKYFPADSSNKREIVADLLGKITRREGIGSLLAEGPAVVARELGLMDRMPQIKGLGFPAYDPRISYGTALAYMTADRGACHLRSWPVGRELGGMWADDDLDGRVAFVKSQQDDKAAEESLTVCQFVYGIGLLDPVLARMVNAATGENWDLAGMRLAGERCWTLSRVFSVREGISRKDDYLPRKFAEESVTSGPIAGKVISRNSQDYLLDKYYSLREWSGDGIPGDSLLARLELEEWK